MCVLVRGRIGGTLIAGEFDRVLNGANAFGALGGEPVQQPVGGTGAVGADQQVLAVRAGALGDGTGQDVDVVSHGGGTPAKRGGVEPAFPGRIATASISSNARHTVGAEMPGLGHGPARRNTSRWPWTVPWSTQSGRPAFAPRCARHGPPHRFHQQIRTNPADHVVCFTCEVPVSLGHLNSRTSKFPLRGRRFRASRHRVRSQPVNDPG